MFADVGRMTGVSAVHVVYGVYGPGLVLTVSGVDWTNVAYWPCRVRNFSKYAAPVVSWPLVFVWRTGTTQMKTMVDKTMTMAIIMASA